MVTYDKRVRCEFAFVDSGFRRRWSSNAHVWLLLLFTTVIEKGKPETQKATSSLPGTQEEDIAAVPPFASLIHTDEGTSAEEEQAVFVPSVRMLHVATFQFSDAAETARYGTAMV